MAKKVRRARRLSEAQSYEPAAVAETAGVAQSSRPAGPRQVNFSEEYHYIITDLRRIAILATVILGGLVALSFFVR